MEKEKKHWIIGIILLTALTIRGWSLWLRAYFSQLKLEDNLMNTLFALICTIVLFDFIRRGKESEKKYWVALIELNGFFAALSLLSIIKVLSNGTNQNMQLDSLLFGFAFLATATFALIGLIKKRKFALYLVLLESYAFAFMFFLISSQSYLYCIAYPEQMHRFINCNYWAIAFDIIKSIEHWFLLSMVATFAFFAYKTKKLFGIESIIPEKIGKKKFFSALILFSFALFFVINISYFAQIMARNGIALLCDFSNFECILTAAIQSSDYSKCEALKEKSPLYHANCLSGYAVLKKDMSVCEKINYIDSTDRGEYPLRDVCFNFYGLQNNDVTACEKINFVGDGYSMRDFCYFHNALESKEKQYCNKISDANTKAECFEAI
ncbi:MAG: hypothetical protein QXK06_05425 [Candidatus Diapherotrites archaeon]